MIIDAPRKEAIPRLRELWQQAFGDTDAFLDGFFNTGFSPDRCRCLQADGVLAAALYWFDCDFRGKKLAYIYAVATDAAFRGRGLCRALMEDTHEHLRRLGYRGAVLVPGDRELFSLYGKLGYRSFCPMTQLRVLGEQGNMPLETLTPEAYETLRRQRLPAGGILQEGATLAFLETFTGFYAWGDGCFCAAREGSTVYFQEYLADPALLPVAVAALGGNEGVALLPGDGPDRGMYLPLAEREAIPQYLGLALN